MRLTKTWPATRKQQIYTPWSSSDGITRANGPPIDKTIKASHQLKIPMTMVLFWPRRLRINGSVAKVVTSVVCEIDRMAASHGESPVNPLTRRDVICMLNGQLTYRTNTQAPYTANAGIRKSCSA